MKNHFSRNRFYVYILFISLGIQFAIPGISTCSAQSITNPATYESLIKQADIALNTKDYATALLNYDKAKNTKPELAYAKTKIAEINALLDANPELRSSLFEDIVILAENFYKQKNYSQAKTEFQKALLLDPTTQYAKDRLAQIAAIYTDPDDQAYFTNAVNSGDQALANQEFEKAIQFYETALAVKPGVKTVKDKIANSRKLQSEYIVKTEQAKKVVAGADKLFQAGKLTEARAEYQKALDILPGNAYANQKIQEIDRITADKKALQDNYDKLIELADQLYINRDFANAHIKYTEALNAKPGARYPKEMIEKTKSGESQLLSDQQRYDAAIASADNLFTAGDLEAAIISYKSAASIKPTEAYPKTKIAEIEKTINERTTRREAYDIAIKNGDQALADAKYDVATGYYRNALTLLPNEKYPEQKINEITLLTGEKKKLDEDYKKVIAEADKFFAQKSYTNAIESYGKALLLKPSENYPQKQIAEAQAQLDKLRNIDESYASAIAKADQLYSGLNYEEALAEYKLASTIKPNEKYPKDKTIEINKITSKLKSDNEKYSLAISNGDKAFSAGNLNLALTSFQGALAIKPGEKYPQDKIEEIKSAISINQEKSSQYAEAIASGDKLFANKDFDAAINAYNEALKIKEAEKYPKEQLLKIDKILADQRSAEENYSGATSEGDNYYNANKYPEAIAAYKRAIAAKPTEIYPKTQIEKINSLIAEQKKTDTDYAAAIAMADKQLALGKFDDAISNYRKASALKPSEKYPLDKISETENRITTLKDLQESYDKSVAEGDNYLMIKDFQSAIASYKNATTFKPSEVYPKQKITEIQLILDKDKAEGQRYLEAIAQADKLFNEQKNAPALEAYQRAATIKPTEKYPNEQISKINQLIADQKKLDENYIKLIADATAQYKAAKYQESKTLFTEASALKPSEKLPKEKINEIDGILADLQNKEESFTRHINEGDASFAAKNYSEAISSYSSALKIKPDNTHAKEQIGKINVIVAEIQKTDADYLAAISMADKLHATEKYEDAIAGYQKALTLKPTEKYPSEKIAAINKQLADIKALQEAFDKSVTEGNNYFSGKNYANALESFKTASTLKPNEVYPKQKITEIQAILDKDKAEGQRYQEAITQADKLYTEQKYSPALETYQRASAIKPAEKYPQEQIEKINQIIAQQKKLDEDYKALVTEAELKLKETKYEEAKTLFQNAGTLKPSENLPKLKIAEIDGKLAAIQQLELSYADAIKKGDDFYAGKNFVEAISSYKKAIEIKSSETYPKTQIEKINALLSEQKKLDDNYLAVLTAADQLYEGKKYSEAIPEYRKAQVLKPSETYPAEKIADAEKQISTLKATQEAYDKAIADGEKKYIAKEYENAIIAFKTAQSVKPDEDLPNQKINEIQVIISKIKADNDRYNEAIALGDKFFAANKYREALEPYQGACTIKPSEKYPQDQIIRINQLLAEQKKLDEEYQTLITQAETQLVAKKYDEALLLFNKSKILKPTETLPKEKIAEIERILADLKAKDEKYDKAINSASELYTSKNLTGSLSLYEEASAIKPTEKLPLERIAAIKAELQLIDINYSKAIALGDSKLSGNNLMEALNAYQTALEVKPAEKYPQTKITEINNLLSAQKEEQEKLYNSFIVEGDQLLATKDYKGAKSAFTKADGIKPYETYPKQKLSEINKITEEIELARKAEYQKALGEADKLYNTKVFDLAIDAYENASKINPDDTYPQIQISKIRKYMVDHAVQDLYAQSAIISEGNEKKFSFTSIEPRLRKNNYILLKARSTGKTAPKVYLSYGKDNQKNGSIVLRSIDKSTISDLIIRISVQDKWYREDNNWISLFVETGDIEITKVQITAGEE